jgi:hypothetical protein
MLQAALSFMRLQAHRDLLNPLDGSPPGSPWWRAVTRACCGTAPRASLVGGAAGEPSSRPVELCSGSSPSRPGGPWYRAHNASILSPRRVLPHRYPLELRVER